MFCSVIAVDGHLRCLNRSIATRVGDHPVSNASSVKEKGKCRFVGACDNLRQHYFMALHARKLSAMNVSHLACPCSVKSFLHERIYCALCNDELDNVRISSHVSSHHRASFRHRIRVGAQTTSPLVRLIQQKWDLFAVRGLYARAVNQAQERRRKILVGIIDLNCMYDKSWCNDIGWWYVSSCIRSDRILLVGRTSSRQYGGWCIHLTIWYAQPWSKKCLLAMTFVKS